MGEGSGGFIKNELIGAEEDSQESLPVLLLLLLLLLALAGLALWRGLEEPAWTCCLLPCGSWCRMPYNSNLWKMELVRAFVIANTRNRGGNLYLPTTKT